MTDEELVHQKWTHSQLGDELRTEVRSWPWIILWQIQGIKLAFLHYALDTGGMSFKRLTRSPSAESYDVLFDLDADYVFFGHNHVRSTFRGRAWYINPGSSGCLVKAEFPYLHLTIENGSIDVQHRLVNYDDRILFEDFENRRVPAREFIYQAFFGSRFSPVKHIDEEEFHG
jgi:predicted phosphodiesterase